MGTAEAEPGVETPTTVNGSGGEGPLSGLLCVTETSERLEEHLEHEPLDQCGKTSESENTVDKPRQLRGKVLDI